jgi:antitoxin YefM
MKTTSYSQLRRHLSTMLDQVSADQEPLIITRDKGKPTAVLMSLEDFSSFEETRYLLQNPHNATRLEQSITELEKGQGQIREVDEQLSKSEAHL